MLEQANRHRGLLPKSIEHALTRIDRDPPCAGHRADRQIIRVQELVAVGRRVEHRIGLSDLSLTRAASALRPACA